MKNYIDFYYDNNNHFIADIHKEGKHLKVIDTKDVEKLISICDKYGYDINHEGKLNKDVLEISNEFDKYRKRIKKLMLLGQIKSDMTVSKKNTLKGRILIASTITILLTSLDSTKMKKSDAEIPLNDISYEQEIDDSYNDEVVINAIPTENDKEIIINSVPSNVKNKIENNDELEKMFNKSEFHFNCSAPIYEECLIAAKRYDDIFEKYSKMYGVDKEYLEAKAALETGGDHYNTIDSGSACGIMQIERSANVGRTIEAYNFETGEIDKLEITTEALRDLDTNIKIGTMISQNCFEKWDYNIPLAIQEYNMGPGNIEKMLKKCAECENLDRSEIVKERNHPKWLDYRSCVKAGDSKYVEHVLRYIKNGHTLKFRRIDNKEYECLTVYNSYNYAKIEENKKN